MGCAGQAEEHNTRYTIDEPINPRVGLTIDEPVVSQERRGDHQSGAEFGCDILGQVTIAIEDKGLDEIVAQGNRDAETDRKPEAGDVQELRFEAGTAILLLAAPLVDRHHLEGDEDEEIEEGAVVLAEQGELHAEQGGHDDTGEEAREVLRVTHGEDICDANDRSGNADYPGGVVKMQELSLHGWKQDFHQPKKAEEGSEKEDRGDEVAAEGAPEMCVVHSDKIL